MSVSHDDGRQAYLSFGDHGTWLLPRNAREGSTAPKVDHIAYMIENWDKDKVEAELKRRGLTPRADRSAPAPLRESLRHIIRA